MCMYILHTTGTVVATASQPTAALPTPVSACSQPCLGLEDTCLRKKRGSDDLSFGYLTGQ
jgi:hypothetical protein